MDGRRPAEHRDPHVTRRVYDLTAGLRDRITENLRAFDRRPIDPGDRRPAAVAIALVAGDRDDEVWTKLRLGRMPGKAQPEGATSDAAFVLTARTAGLRAHASQWALPGGRIDPDEDPAATARRELLEEVGVRTDAEDVVGLLDDFATRSGFVITPVVVWAGATARLDPSAAEVESVHRVPLGDLDHDGSPRFVDIPESDAPVVQLWLRGRWIHAPTAAILYQFRDVALHGRSTRVAHLEQPVWAWR